MVDFNVTQGLRDVLQYQDDINNQRNPNEVTAEQIGSYDKATIDAKLAMKAGSGSLPFSQFGDLSFIPPNISSRYEGATPISAQVVYQVEADGSRNFLRNGTDGQVSGVYLCKLVTDANDNIVAYNPMATPWVPAALPAGDRIDALMASLPGQVAVRCFGTAGGLLPAAGTYYMVTTHPNTLNPDLHTSAILCTVEDTSYNVDPTIAFLFSEGTRAYLGQFVNETNLVNVRIDRLRNLAIGAAGGRIGTWSGTDLLGQAVTANPGVKAATALMGTPGAGNAYLESDSSIFSSAWQTAPSASLYKNADGTYRVILSHESWTGVGVLSDRKMVTRVVDIDIANFKFTWLSSTTGAIKVVLANNTLTLTGQMVGDYLALGWPAIGNFNNCMSRCPRSGEVFSFSCVTMFGSSSGAWSPKMPLAQYLNPPTRVKASSLLDYKPNYPSVVGASIHNPTLTPSGHLNIMSSQGPALVLSPKFSAPIPYTYPNRAATTWAVDSGRKVAIGQPRSRLAVVMRKTGEILVVGSVARDRLSSFVSYNDDLEPKQADGTPSVAYSVVAAVFDQIENYIRSEQSALGIKELYTQLYHPQFVGGVLDNSCVSLTSILTNSGDGYSYLMISTLGTWSGTQLQNITIRQGRVSAQTISKATATIAPSIDALPLYIGEMDDYMFIGGSGPLSFQYSGNSGIPSQAVGVTASEVFSIADYQAHEYASPDAYFCLPVLGVVRQWTDTDNNFTQTTSTGGYYGMTRAGLSAAPQMMVILSQAVFGSWNVYVSEEIYTQINGIFGNLPKITFDLSTIKSNPANSTFYLYVQLTGQTLNYVMSPTALNSDRSRIFCGSIVTDATHVSAVNVVKAFSVDGFSLSDVQIATAIPASIGSPTEPGNINWPSL